MCYYLAIWLGEQSCAYIDKLGAPYTVLKFGPESIIGKSHYEMGNNYSATQILLKQALQHINSAIRLNYFSSLKLRGTRIELCGYIILMNWVCNPLFYIYLFKDMLAIVFCIVPIILTIVPYFFWAPMFEHKESIPSTDTGLAKQYSFFWPQVDPFYCYEQWITTVKQWMMTVFYSLLLVFGTIMFYCGYTLLLHYLVKCIIRKRVLYSVLFIALIIIIPDWM